MIKKIDKLKEPPKLAIIFSNAVFVFGIIYSILIATYALYKIFSSYEYVNNTFYLICILFSGISGILFGLGLRLVNNLKLNLSILFVTITISIYTFETIIEFSQKIPQHIEIAKQMGIAYDTRTKIEVIQNYNKLGVEIYPIISSQHFISSNGVLLNHGTSVRKYNSNMIPLGGISNIKTIYCNEEGYWSIYDSDEHGFNNIKGIYKKDKIDIVLLGDSFSQGACVKPDQNIGAVLRELDFNIINFGNAGNGPLANFATLKEYAIPLKPKIILWQYFANDFKDLEWEKNSSILMSYLNKDDFSQNLISRQSEIDSLLKGYLQKELKNNIRLEAKESNTMIELLNVIKIRFMKILKLTNLRVMMNFEPEPQVTNIFRNILEKSKKIVSENGGKIYFIYFPQYHVYLKGNTDSYREVTLHAIKAMGIQVIDLHKEVFALHPDPLSLFPFRIEGHYNAEGYRLVAEAIGKRLKKDGLFH